MAKFFATLHADELAAAVRMIWGKPVPRSLGREPTVGFSTIWKAVLSIWKVESERLSQLLLKHGDLGDAVGEAALLGRRFESFEQRDLSILDVSQAAEKMALAEGSGSTNLRLQLLLSLLSRCSPLETKYLIKVFTGEMRVGVESGIIEEALAEAFRVEGELVRRMTLAHGDLGDVAVSLLKGIREASVGPGAPAGFMLAEPMANAHEALEHFGKRVICEFKYDGVRAQAHKWDGKVRIFSRRLEDESASFPEIVDALTKVPHTLIFDGEILGFRDGRPLPFALLQRRLRRKNPGLLAGEIPIQYFIYDVIYLDGISLVEKPLLERKKMLEQVELGDPLRRVETFWVGKPDEIERLFENAVSSGYEG